LRFSADAVFAKCSLPGFEGALSTAHSKLRQGVMTRRARDGAVPPS
jgi:hypothetical protein